MSEDISGFNTSIRLIASNTFPVGFTITQFADDADPLAVEDLTIAEGAMGLNGDGVFWSKPNLIMASISVIPDSDDDVNLALLFEANRTGRGKKSAKDSITAIVMRPSGVPVTYTNGKMFTGAPSFSVSSAGRMKTKTYKFAFEGKVGV